MPFTMHQSRRFVREFEACNAYRQQTGGVNEYLIYRFDSDDSTLSNIFSIDYKTPVRSSPLPGGIYPAQRGRLNSSKTKVTKPQNYQGGGHAEEIFLRSLDKFTSYGPVGRIEMYISKIPCNYSSAMMVNVNGSNHHVPSGCGNKLQLMIEAFTNINWYICFDREYSGATQGRETKQKMLVLDAKMNCEVYRYNNGALNRVSAN
ncbi:hypothetical protein ACJJIP_14625 [Microbulbifer sp. VTAC004]|uniref:hypothetical protein n=1 Tax=unclassified Microbulbifer TaxID=2619833 RepID=UPI00403920FE